MSITVQSKILMQCGCCGNQFQIMLSDFSASRDGAVAATRAVGWKADDSGETIICPRFDDQHEAARDALYESNGGSW